jgi:diguanylate cyclase (GGDEF)-like protein
MRLLRQPADTVLVPLQERLRWMHTFRIVTVVATLVCWWLVPASRGLSLPALLTLAVVYLMVTAATAPLGRLERGKALRVFGFSLLCDGIYLAVLSYASSGINTPTRFLILLHLMAVTLLASFRTGLKITLWHSLLLYVYYRLVAMGYVAWTAGVGDARVPVMQVSQFVILLWLCALATATFAAVNERELRRRSYDLEALARLGWRLDTTTTAQDHAQTLVDVVAQEFGFTRVYLSSTDGEGRTTTAGHGRGAAYVTGGPNDDASSAAAMAEHRTLLLTGPHPDDSWLRELFPDPGNIGLIPLHADGKALGVLVFEHNLRRARIEQRVVAMVERFASQTSLALANAWLLERVQDLATTDGLTGVANRRAFEDRFRLELRRAQAGDGPLGVILIDIDRFKKINDEHGHQAGDEVLRHVAAAIRHTCRPTDAVARYGGEEFVALLPGASGDDTSVVAERIRLAVATIDGPVSVTASLGTATYPTSVGGAGADHTDVGHVLLGAADKALYQAKATGRNRVVSSALVEVS